MTNEQKANLLLGISTAGFVCTYWGGNSFEVGLIHACCGAAMVGGIADYLAIKALFEPVKFDPHSNLLYEKRDKLIEAMVDFSTKDVLDKESVKEAVGHRDIVALILEYWEKRDGREKIKNVAIIALGKILDETDIKSIVDKLMPHFRLYLKDNRFLTDKLPILLKTTTESRNTVIFYAALLQLAKFIYNEPKFQEILKKDIHELNENFLGTRVDRRLARLAGHLASSGLSDDDILRYLNDWINKQLKAAIESPESSYVFVKDKICQLLSDKQVWAKLEKKKNDFIDQADLEKWLYENLEDYCTNHRDKIFALVGSLLDMGIEHIKHNSVSVNAYLQNKLVVAVEENYEELPDMIRRTINDKGDRYIVDMVHEKAGDNLQAIRISGSGVGAIVGTLLYLLSSSVKAVFG